MTPCRLCGVETPVETICHVADPSRTYCPACREAVDGLALANTQLLRQAARAQAAEKAAA